MRSMEGIISRMIQAFGANPPQCPYWDRLGSIQNPRWMTVRHHGLSCSLDASEVWCSAAFASSNGCSCCAMGRPVAFLWHGIRGGPILVCTLYSLCQTASSYVYLLVTSTFFQGLTLTRPHGLYSKTTLDSVLNIFAEPSPQHGMFNWGVAHRTPAGRGEEEATCRSWAICFGDLFWSWEDTGHCIFKDVVPEKLDVYRYIPLQFLADRPWFGLVA